jgi:NDP-sugar pyrophosphorylase family protein
MRNGELELIVCVCVCVHSFYEREAPIYTMPRFLPPSKILDAMVTNSIIGDGCVVRANATVTHSVVGVRALICKCPLQEIEIQLDTHTHEPILSLAHTRTHSNKQTNARAYTHTAH